jgi:hypothetical protein
MTQYTYITIESTLVKVYSQSWEINEIKSINSPEERTELITEELFVSTVAIQWTMSNKAAVQEVNHCNLPLWNLCMCYEAFRL